MPNNKRRNFWFVFILGIALLLRIMTAFYLGDSLTGPQQERIYDQVSYNTLAQSLLAGRGYSFPEYWYPFTPADTPTAHWSFLYPLILAVPYSLFGYHPIAARLIQAIIVGILSVWLFYRLGNRLAGEKVGLATAALGAVYPYFVFHDAALMTEPLFIIGVLAMLDISLNLANIFPPGLAQKDGVDHQQTRDWILLGIILGLTTLLRQTVLLWLPFLFIWLIWFRRSRMHWWQPVITLAIVGLFILPWTIRNYRVYDAFLPLNSNAGYALYSANHPHHGTHFDQDFAAPLPEDLVSMNLNEAQWNTELTRRGLEFVLQDPIRYIELSFSRFGIFFNFWFSAESSRASNLMRVFSFGLYLPLYILGLLLTLQSWRRFSLLYLFAVVYSLMHILTWASIRYRLPIDAALLPLAAIGVLSILSWLKLRLGLGFLPEFKIPLQTTPS